MPPVTAASQLRWALFPSQGTGASTMNATMIAIPEPIAARKSISFFILSRLALVRFYIGLKDTQ
jgi:hypothetical protein